MHDSRCPWCGDDPVYVAYHDTEWGRPERDGRALYEKLTLDAFQAGLSWITILRKRPGFRAAFDGFDPERVARYGADDVARLLADPGIVRHRGKIEAAIGNARRVAEMGAPAFAALLWGHVGGRPQVNAWTRPAEIPAQTAMSRDLARDLTSRGFRFCGPTVVYAFAQAVGMVNDHLIGCPAHAVCAAAWDGPSGAAG